MPEFTAPMTGRSRKAWLAVAIIALCLIVFPVALQSLLFFVGIGVTSITFLAGIALGIYAPTRILPRSRTLVLGYLVVFAVAAAALAVASPSWDNTHDSLTYHEPAIIALEAGSNPVYGDLRNFWADHYPKAAWVFSAGVYAVSGNLESAKVITALLALACFAFALFTLSGLPRVPRWLAVITATLIALNPVTLVQLDTHYVDGLFANLAAILLLLILAPHASPPVDKVSTQRAISTIAIMAAALLANLKFTGLVFIVSLATLYGVRILLTEGWPGVERRRRLSARVVILAMLAATMGFSPYVTNWVRDGHPLYPVFGADLRAIPDAPDIGQRPAPYRDRSAPVAFAMSLLERTSIGIDEPFEPKNPFTVSTPERDALAFPDPRRGGFGPLFLISLCGSLVIPASLFRGSTWPKALRSTTAWLLLTTLVLTLAMLEAWWARLAPHFYLIPVIVAFAGLAGTNSRGAIRIVSSAILLALIANSVLIGQAQVLDYTARLAQRSELLSSLAGVESVDIRFPSRWTETQQSASLERRLADAGFRVHGVPHDGIPSADWRSSAIMKGELRVR